MEPLIYKQIRTGNYNKKTRDSALNEVYRIKDLIKNKGDSEKSGNLYAINILLKILKDADLYLKNAMAFNLKNISHIICPKSIIMPMDCSPCIMPYDIVWIEGYGDNLKESDGWKNANLFIKTKVDPEKMDEKEYKDASFIVCVGAIKEPSGDVHFALNISAITILDNKFDLRGDHMRIFTPWLFSDDEKMKKDMIAIGSSEAAQFCCFSKMCEFLNIKNVSVKKEQFAGLTQRQKRINRLSGGLSYHTLVVSKPGATRSSEGTGEYEGTIPLHLCRGHTATYTAEKPLFGKYEGTFYIPAHVRGKLENGVVAKDYLLKSI